VGIGFAGGTRNGDDGSNGSASPSRAARLTAPNAMTECVWCVQRTCRVKQPLRECVKTCAVVCACCVTKSLASTSTADGAAEGRFDKRSVARNGGLSDHS